MSKQAFVAHFIASNWGKFGPVALLAEAKKAWAVYDDFLKHG